MTGIIILCRYNSSRLYGKILKKINGKEVLKYIIERLSGLAENHPIIVCTSKEETDNPIEEFCKKNNVTIFRGSLNNVANRFLSCAQEYEFENAVRINGDNLFLDPFLIKSMINVIENENIQFISNVKNRTFPKGMSVEIVNIEFYKQHIENFKAEDFEHVMTYFYRLNQKGIRFVFNKNKYSKTINLAIDTKEDFDNAAKIINMMKQPHTNYGIDEILKLFKQINKDEK